MKGISMSIIYLLRFFFFNICIPTNPILGEYNYTGCITIALSIILFYVSIWSIDLTSKTFSCSSHWTNSKLILK